MIESGADAREYKLLLVKAVASSRGMAMTNWLKQSNLKKRIDMLEKEQSSGSRKLRALFIPLIAALYLFASAQMAHGGNASAPYPMRFEHHVVWIFSKTV